LRWRKRLVKVRCGAESVGSIKVEDRGDSGLQAMSPLYVERGLFALRYVSADDEKEWPTAEVFLPPGVDGKVRQICAPGVSPGRLSGPGACIVLHAEAPGLIRIGLRPATPSGSLKAVIKLERLDLNTPSPPLAAAPTTATPAIDEAEGNAPPRFALSAHIARRGDVEIAPGQWAGGPEAPGRIEGLLIKPHAFDTASLEIQVLSLGAPAWSSWCGSGAFIGTRGRATPLVGLRARLVGSQAHRWLLVAEAMFLGSPLVERQGQEIELSANFGADPLVGLRLDVKSTRAAAARTAPATGAREPQVKIFRAGGARR
jgi:hypothetical protein